jgi:hypothetical protein
MFHRRVGASAAGRAMMNAARFSSPSWPRKKQKLWSGKEQLRDVRAGLRVRVLPRLTSYQIYRSNFVVLGFDRPMSLSTIYLAMCVSEMEFF